ncbi:MAG: sterol desaturase family protein, partial [Acidimicrobiales bacterium]
LAGVVVFTGPIEWAVHLFLLHSDPDSFRARRLGTGVGHHQHHLDPPKLEYLLLTGADAGIFVVVLALSTAVWSVPLLWLSGSAVGIPFLTALVATYVALANYEWTHLLVHTPYRPRTGFYRRLARNHRRHHYRNENYWLGITSNLGDRIMGTLPRSRTDVPLSGTASTLGHDGAGT